jgi:hypothetical protein
MHAVNFHHLSYSCERVAALENLDLWVLDVALLFFYYTSAKFHSGVFV